MLIDWFTVTAQLVNFLILIALLRHLLYRPILAAMARREQRIADALREADRRMAAAAGEQAAWAARNQVMEAEAAARRRALEAELVREREVLTKDAEARVRRLETRWRRAVASRRTALARSFAERAQAETVATARAVLADLADTTLEARMAGVFLTRLASLAPADRHQLGEALAAGATVVSAAPLAADARAAITRALAELGGQPPAFATDAALVAGIELVAGPLKLGWTVAEHLERLAARAAQALDEVTDADAA